MKRWQFVSASAVGTLLLLASSGTALADGHGNGDGGTVCTSGTVTPGHYRNLTVTGVCQITSGLVHVNGDVVIRPGALLDAVSSAATVVVGGDIRVEHGAVLFLGCGFSLGTCTNTTPGPDLVRGSIVATEALGVVIHAVTVRGDLSIIGGGGGPSVAVMSTPGACFGATPPAPWSTESSLAGVPVYSDVEDTFIGGDLRIVGLQTCWLGGLRNTVRGDFIDVNNQMGDPDANEMLDNIVGRNLACFGNTPAVQVGDSTASSNTVYGRALGECSPPAISTVVAGEGDRDSH